MNKIIEIGIIVFSWICGITLTGSISVIIGYLFFKGFHTINTALIFGDVSPMDAIMLKKQVFDGIFPAMAGTFLLVLLAVLFALPVGLASGIYLAEYASADVKNILGIFFDILAGIPSIVIGLFGLSAAIFLHKQYSDQIYPSLLISGISLGFLSLPYIIRTTQISLESIPLETRLTALALGATKLQNIIYVLIPKSLSGIVSGVILAIGRCAEDTAVIMLTGVVATAGVPKSLFSHYEALPFYIYYISSQYADNKELMKGYGAAVILLLICVMLLFTAFLIKKGVAFKLEN